MSTEKTDKPEAKKGVTFVPILIEVGFDISIPLVIFILIGVWLDKQFHAGHLFLFSGIALSLFSSSAAIYKAYKKIRVIEGAEEEK